MQLMTFILIIYYVLREKNYKKTSCFNDLLISLLKKIYEGGAFSQ